MFVVHSNATEAGELYEYYLSALRRHPAVGEDLAIRDKSGIYRVCCVLAWVCWCTCLYEYVHVCCALAWAILVLYIIVCAYVYPGVCVDYLFIFTIVQRWWDTPIVNTSTAPSSLLAAPYRRWSKACWISMAHLNMSGWMPSPKQTRRSEICWIQIRVRKIYENRV